MLLGVVVLSSVDAQKAKSCKLGVEKACPGKNVTCVSIADEPGSSGVCAKMCHLGTEKPCPTGETCYTSGDYEPGAAGGCVKDALCYPEKHQEHMLTDLAMTEILAAYEYGMNWFYRELFMQVIEDPKMPPTCNGEDHIKCPAGMFCLIPPMHSEGVHAEGDCFKPVENMPYEMCISGTEDPCPEGEMCMTVPDSPMGAMGMCVPDGSKACMIGEKNTCPKGHMCHWLEIGNTNGWCRKDMVCDGPHWEVNRKMYWEFHVAWNNYEWSLSPAEKAEVIKAIKDWNKEHEDH